MDKRVLVIGGPTGSGETTISEILIKKYPLFKKLVTATSRSIRSGEQEGINYYFFSKEQFKKEIAKDNILEHTHIKSRDVYYGCYRPDLETKISQDYNIIVNTDIIGVNFYKKNFNATSIFLMPDSLSSLRGRIRNRNPEIADEELEKRMGDARNEVEKEKPDYDYTVINADGKMEKAIEEIISILKKEGYNLN